MAKKMYYSEEETAQKLGVDVDQLDAFQREGKLRGFRDGTKRVFKADEVDALASQAGPDDTSEIELAPAASDEISLAEADESAAPAGKEDTVITAEGISIFDDEDLEIEAADPMAKTQIAPSLEDQFAVEGVGSGSGLLDLTQESDDTSLGAEVLDNIDMDGDIADQISEPEPYVPAAPTMAEPPVVMEEPDASAGLFGGLAVGAAVVAVIIGIAAFAAGSQTATSFVQTLQENILVVVGAVVVVLIIAAIVGLVLGKSAANRAAVMQRM